MLIINWRWVEECEHLQAIWAEIRGRLGDHSSFICFCQDMSFYNVNWALQDYLHSLFDALRKGTATFCSVSSSQAKRHDKTVC